MCVIISKEKGKKLPSKEFLYNCFKKNPDGSGFMYEFEHEVYIEKGFMDFDSLYNRLKELDSQINLQTHSLVMHFRISTSGKVDKENCHPYPITQNIDLMRETFLKTKDIAFCHNGIIRNYQSHDKIHNDTQTFGVNVLSVFKEHYPKFYEDKNVLKMLNLLAQSKLCFLDSEGKITYVGDFQKYRGMKCSNLYFIKPKYTYPSYDYRYGISRTSHGQYRLFK